MIHLDKISLSNARRFGKDVEINFGKGATILLAPNGTGKTTVFEAIELALTGQYKRLGNPPLALIRDKETELDVRLDFSNSLFCEVAFRKGQLPKLKGNHNELFSKNIDSIPYLLRLTHLLEQRGADWFVDTDENKAANRLDKLSIGQDLNQIISKKRSILSAITKERARLEKKLLESKDEMSDFNKKIAARKKVEVGIELIPLSVIYEQIKSFYKLINENTERKVDDNVNSVIAFAEQTKSVINQKLKDNAEKSHLYAELDGSIELFDANNNLLLIKLKENDTHFVDIKKLENDLINFNRNKENENDKLNIQLNKLKELDELKTSILLLNTKYTEKDQATKEITFISKNLLDFQKNLKIAIENLKNGNKLIDQHKLIDAEFNNIQTEKNQIEKLEKLQKEWEANTVTINKLNLEIIPNILKKKVLQEGENNEITEELKLANLNYKEKVKSLNLLKQASNAIQDAVSVIASNLPKDRRDCPVCGADYEPINLQKRISVALDKINPLITDAVFNEKQALEKLEQVKEKLNVGKIKLEKCIGELDASNKQLNEILYSIEKSILPRFVNCKSANNASEYIKDKQEALGARIELLNKSKMDIDPKPDLEFINSIKIEKNELERTIDDLEKKNNTVNRNLTNLLQSIKEIQFKIGDLTLEKVLLDVDEIEKTKNIIKESILIIEKKQITCQDHIKKLNEQRLEKNEIISKLKSQQDGIKNKWGNAGLDGIPSEKKLIEVKNQLLKETNELNNLKEKLIKLDEELSRWRSAEKYKDLDKEIKEKIKPYNEQAYIEKLEGEITKNTNVFANFEEKQSTLKNFFDNANNELSAIHDYIISINPYWSALLKRVLINPRFSETDLLNSGTYNNQPYANVRAYLHDDKMKVANIASEAQLTDLQLTFMLTMAKTYEWTPWKALLLDDPTQHHDLVHASSVFDLLRDYIVDLDFQVMMSTHDSIQANFFQRKLQNDGVKTKIYRLKSENSGVVAECLE